MNFSRLENYLDTLEAPRIYWWRDDDTGDDLDSLQRLLELRHEVSIPLVVSVVPLWASADCCSLLERTADTFVAQHGYDHSDHATQGEKSVELGGSVAPECVLDRVRQGQQSLKAHQWTSLLALLVPPWNRLSEEVIENLPDLGFKSLSTFAKDRRGWRYGLEHINCHIDPIVWREGKRQMTADELIDVTIRQLEVNSDKPTGLLSHHLEMDDRAYELLAGYLKILSRHPNIECRDPSLIFGLMHD